MHTCVCHTSVRVMKPCRGFSTLVLFHCVGIEKTFREHLQRLREQLQLVSSTSQPQGTAVCQRVPSDECVLCRGGRGRGGGGGGEGGRGRGGGGGPGGGGCNSSTEPVIRLQRYHRETRGVASGGRSLSLCGWQCDTRHPHLALFVAEGFHCGVSWQLCAPTHTTPSIYTPGNHDIVCIHYPYHILVRESVDSLCRDGADTPMPPYIGKAFTRTNVEELSLFKYVIMVCE